MRDEIREVLAAAWGSAIAIDTETDAKDIRFNGKCKGLSIAFRHNGYLVKRFFPISYDGGGNISEDELAGVKLLIENAPEIVFHNAKFDISSLETVGIYTENSKWFCTMVMSSLINENWPKNRSLDSLSKVFLKKPGKVKSEEFKLALMLLGWDGLHVRHVEEYAEEDAGTTFELGEYIIPRFYAQIPAAVWEYKRKFINVIRHMEKRGILINQEYCQAQEEIGRREMENMRAKLRGINPSSTLEMEELLLNEWGLPPMFLNTKLKSKGAKLESEQASAKKAWDKLVDQFGQHQVPPYDPRFRTSLTFNAEAMHNYKRMMLSLNRVPDNFVKEFPDYVLMYKGWEKASSSYYGAYLRLVNEDGRLRPNYVHHKSDDAGGTVTGRLACKDPNLQQIPREPEADEQALAPWKKVKQAFMPTPGYHLYECDYSQLELRILTGYAGEGELKRTFLEDRDLFTEMAGKLVFPRQVIKKFVYMTNYGAGPEKISRDIEIPLSEALKLKTNYYTEYPGFLRVNQECTQSGQNDKKIKLWSGRYRNFESAGEGYKAMNSLIQGGGADIVERAMVRIFEEVDQKSNGEVRMLLTVHDSIWFEIMEGTENKWLPQILNLMTDVKALGANFDVKFAAEAKRLDH